MTDPQSYFRSATDTLEPDVDALVTGGLARGRARRSRRTALAAIGAGTAVAVLAAGAAAVPGLVGGAPEVIAPGSGNNPSGREAPSATVSTPSAQRVRTLAVKPADVPGEFGSIVGGEVAADQGFPSDHDGVIAHFRWNGAFTSVIIDFLPGKRPIAQCQASAQRGMTCAERPDGSAVLTWQERQPLVDGGVTTRSVALFAVDGWQLTVLSYNAADPKSSEYVAPEPPLSFDQLERVVTSDAWFR